MCKTSPDSMGTASFSVGSDSQISNKIACFWRKTLLRLKGRRSRKACLARPFRQQELHDKDHRNTIDDIPCNQMPPPLDVQEEYPSHGEHPMVVYICDPPMGRPSSMQLADRVTSTLSELDDIASQESDKGDLASPPSSQRVATCRPSQIISTGPPKPLSTSSRRVSTYGSTTTQSSRHRRLTLTVSPSSLRQVYDSVENGSQESPFPELGKIDGSVSGDSSVRPKIVDTTEPRLAESEKWMEGWVAAAGGGGQAEEPVQEKRDEISIDNKTSSEQVESTYLPRCPWLEHAFLSSGSKMIFAGWVLYSPNDAPVQNLPVRQDIVYVMMLENIPKIYLARDKDQDMSTLDVSPKMRVEIKDISKSHGRGVVLHQDGVAHGTFVPISLPSFMFKNQSLVDDNEFEDLAYRTIAPFRRDSCTKPLQWCHTEYHQEYAPEAQLDAAMHLMFVMDSWMTKMLKR